MRVRPLGLAFHSVVQPATLNQTCWHYHLLQPNLSLVFHQSRHLRSTPFCRVKDGRSDSNAPPSLASPSKQPLDWKDIAESASNPSSSPEASQPALPSSATPDSMQQIFSVLQDSRQPSSSATDASQTAEVSPKDKFIFSVDFLSTAPSRAATQYQDIHLPSQTNDRPPRIGPTAGRTVLVQGDVVQAFTRLRQIVAQNKVRQDLMKQRFHERPGLKRKRLKRERHRKRFKEGFKRLVGIVLDMKNRGM